jgi:hypothetical protein
MFLMGSKDTNLADFLAPDQVDPGAEGVGAAPDDALKRSIADWAGKLKEVEAIRRREAAVRETNDAVDDLARLRAIGMNHAERTDREASGILTCAEQEAVGRGTDPAIKFVRVARAVRQIVVLQQEVLGLRPVAGVRVVAEKAADAIPSPAPSPSEPGGLSPTLPRGAGEGLSDRTENDLADRERSDLSERDDLYDYDDRAFPEVVAGVRRTLGVAQGPVSGVSAVPAGVTGRGKARPRARLNASASAVGANARGRGPPG